jgi:phosphoribosylanthranilate isomerase
VQVAGIHDLAEAELLVAAGVDFLGFPLRLPDGREDLEEAEAARVCAALAGRADRVLITYQDDAAGILALAERLSCEWVQLHGEVTPALAAALRARRPQLGLIVALVIRDGDRDAVLDRARAFAPEVDAFITDTFDARTGRRGATGLVHDWQVSRAVVELALRPVILAGGLHAGNVVEAIRQVRPAAVDVHTGVEGADGRKDLGAVTAFVAAAKGAFAARSPAGTGAHRSVGQDDSRRSAP